MRQMHLLAQDLLKSRLSVCIIALSVLHTSQVPAGLQAS